MTCCASICLLCSPLTCALLDASAIEVAEVMRRGAAVARAWGWLL